MEYQLIDSAIGNGAAGVLALVLFVAAYIIDTATGNKRVPAIMALVMAAAGSVMFYGSTWSVTVLGWLSGALNLAFGVFGVDRAPLAFVFSLTVIVTLLVIGFDLKANPWDNPGALWSLFLAPVATHGAGGAVGDVANAIFGGLALGLVDAFNSLTGLL